MKNLLFALFIFTGFSSFASHIVGGEVYYDSLGNDEYRITFEVYRDCSDPFNASFDDPLGYTIFNADGTVFLSSTIALPLPDTLPIVYDDPCVTPPNDVCIERAVYVQIVTMPATPMGYYITYQRCCWSSNIDNIPSPDDWGITISTTVPGTNLVSQDNNCARYNEYPPIVLCSGQTLDFDHSASDLDGDSLVYSLCTPETISINDPGSPSPQPENAAPYAPTPWDVGFSATVPLGPTSNVTIDPQTGMMNITPGPIGTYVMAVCVEEWRNGVLINTKSRTFGYRVVVCDVTLPMQVDVVGSATLIEDCGSAGFVVTRTDSTDAVDLQLFLSGTAENGIDYNQLPAVITMPAGVGTDTISITPGLDALLEGDEDLIFNIVVENPCQGTYDTTTAYITIQDYFNMGIVHTDSINVCDQTDEFGILEATITNGVAPYTYIWTPTYGFDPTVQVPTSTLEPNLNLALVTVIDACGKEIISDTIRIYNQCYLESPNVITADGDGINDFFIIKNREDYDIVDLKIFNRWGNLVYENENYQNDWDGLTTNGEKLTEGTYFYFVTPRSDKYIYDDVERSQYTSHGFVYIIRGGE